MNLNTMTIYFLSYAVCNKRFSGLPVFLLKVLVLSFFGTNAQAPTITSFTHLNTKPGVDSNFRQYKLLNKSIKIQQ